MDIKKGFTIVEIAIVLSIMSLLVYYGTYVLPKIREAERNIGVKAQLKEIDTRLRDYIGITKIIPGRDNGTSEVIGSMVSNVAELIGFDQSSNRYISSSSKSANVCTKADTFSLTLTNTLTNTSIVYNVYYVLTTATGGGTLVVDYMPDGSGTISSVKISNPLPVNSFNIAFATKEDMQLVCSMPYVNIYDKLITPSGAVGTADLSSTSTSYTPLNLVKGNLDIYIDSSGYDNLWYAENEAASSYRYCVKLIYPNPNIPFEGQIYFRTVGDRPDSSSIEFMGLYGYMAVTDEILHDGQQGRRSKNFITSEMNKLYQEDRCKDESDYDLFNNIAPGIVTVDMQYQDMLVFMLYLRDNFNEVKIPIVTHYNYYDSRSICYYLYQSFPTPLKTTKLANFIVPCIPAGRIFKGKPGSIFDAGVPFWPIWSPQQQQAIKLR